MTSDGLCGHLIAFPQVIAVYRALSICMQVLTTAPYLPHR